MSLSIWTKLDTFPPLICRLLARRTLPNGKVAALTDKEIAARAGIPEWEVASYSYYLNWEDVPVRITRQFSRACGVDFDSRDNMRRHRSYMRDNPKFKYLRASPDWAKKYAPLIKLYVEFQQQQ